MASKNNFTLSDLIGEWRMIQKLMFAFLQFTYFMYGWQTFELEFLMPNVKISCDVQDNNASNVTACSTECLAIKYEQDEFKATLTEKLGLVCSKTWLQSFSFTLIMISAIVGNIISGELTDRIGRRGTIFVLLVPYLVGCLLVLFPQGYTMFAVGECLIGIAITSVGTVAYILLFESCGEFQRTFIGVSVNIGFSTGAVVLGLIAWALRHWFYLHIITTSFLVIFITLGFLPESPDWLIKKGKTDEAVRTVKRIVRINGNPQLSDSEIQNAVQQLSDTYNKEADSTKDYVPMLLFGAIYTVFGVLIIKLDFTGKKDKKSKEKPKRGHDNLAMCGCTDDPPACATAIANPSMTERF